ncbi:hypothetical protein C8F01DRAFT_1001585, partial [Mycena amicta]
MPQLPNFPPEVLLEIFQMVPSVHLADLSLANKQFFHLAQPLLFSTFKFHPYALNAEGRPSLLPEPAETERAHQRLEFWASNSIAHSVKHC